MDPWRSFPWTISWRVRSGLLIHSSTTAKNQWLITWQHPTSCSDWWTMGPSSTQWGQRVVAIIQSVLWIGFRSKPKCSEEFIENSFEVHRLDMNIKYIIPSTFTCVYDILDTQIVIHMNFLSYICIYNITYTQRWWGLRHRDIHIEGPLNT